MINPFKAVKWTVGCLFAAANASDCARGPAKIGAALLTPIVAPIAFVTAFFQKGDSKP